MHILNGGNVTGYSETSSLSFSCVYAGFPWLPEFHMGNMKGLVTNFVYRDVVSLRSRRLGGGLWGRFVRRFPPSPFPLPSPQKTPATQAKVLWTIFTRTTSTQAAVAAAGVVIVDV